MSEMWKFSSQLLQIAASLVLVGFLPGFALIHWLFPRADFDHIERFFLSVLSSVAMTCLAAYTLTWTAAGLNPGGMVLISIGLTGSFVLGSAVRVHFATAEHGRSSVDLNQKDQPAAPGLRYWSMGGVLLGLTVVMFMADLRSQPMPLTEFYIAPDFLEAERVLYEKNGNVVEIPVNVVNLEGRAVNYHLEAWAEDHAMSAAYQNALRQTQIWSLKVLVPLPDTQEADYVELQLFEESVHTYLFGLLELETKRPIAELKIWLTHPTQPETVHDR